MAVPKRKTSKARRDKRRANWKLSVPGLVACPRCRKPKLPHRVCGECGHYGRREVIKVD
ncbi:MAG: 50S ribosomal protein L32 [Bacillota bacterium]